MRGALPACRIGGASPGLTAAATVEHLHLVGDDFGRVAIVAVFVLPFARLQPAFDVDLAAFAQVFAGDFAEPREADDDVPLGALLLLAGLFVLPRLGGRKAQVRHRRTALCVSSLRIAPQIADQDDFVDAARHVSSRVPMVVRRGSISHRPLENTRRAHAVSSE